MDNSIKNKFDFNKVFGNILIGLIFLLPIMFLPAPFLSLYSSKIILLLALITVFVALFLSNMILEGNIKIPNLKFLLPILFLPLVATVSSLFSGSLLKSLFGLTFDFGSTASLWVVVSLLFIAIFSIKNNLRLEIKTIYALIASNLVVILHLILRMFASSLPKFLTNRLPDFLVGGSIDTSILLCVFIIAILSLLNYFEFNNKIKYLAYLATLFSVLFIGAVGFKPILVLLAIFSLIYFVYTFSWSINKSEDGSKKISLISLFILASSIIFLLGGSMLSGYFANIFNINSIEVRPNIGTTALMVNESLKSNVLLGAGPNMFKELWDLRKPIEINNTQFWNSDFNFGYSFVFTIFATTGLVGGLLFMVFLVMYFISGFSVVFNSSIDHYSRFVSSTTFFMSAFLWLMCLIFSPSVVVVSMAFIFSGVFVSSAISQNIFSFKDVNITKNPKANFITIFLSTIFLILSIIFAYVGIERIVSFYISQKAINTSTDLESLRSKLAKSIQIVENDLYWRQFSEVSLSSLTQKLSSIKDPKNISEVDRNIIQQEISNSIESAKKSIDWNNKNYINWFTLARVYEILAQAGIEGAFDNATLNYNEALKRSPNNPSIQLAFARLNLLSNKLEDARSYVNKAIQLKNNYIDAYFTLAQIEIASNNIKGAIESVGITTLIEPYNSGLYFQLGILQYNNKDYSNSIISFEKSLSLSPDYANAQYFLGLAYERVGRRTDAIKVFDYLSKTNPENQEVSFILSNLNENKSPFSDVKPPLDDKPEKRKSLPVKSN